jgi:hypothetical protein
MAKNSTDARNREVVSIEEVPTVDDLEESLRIGFQAPIVQGDYWRSLAWHVQDLIRACLKGHGIET